jgi:protein tyrosine phosphatase (PTP) superfamily phosphohydrolase (DUF442 family)
MSVFSLGLWFKRVLAWVLALTALAALALVTWYLVVQWGGNFHEVLGQEIYRSAQLNSQQLEQRVEELHIQSILNLRGANPGESWFDDEMKVTHDHHLTHMDVALSAGTLVSPEQLQNILQMMDQAPKPLLVHCTDGADRTGLVLGLYLESKGVSAAQAHEQLSWRFGHFPHLRWSFTKAMDESYDNYERFIHEPNSMSRPPTP